MLWLVPLWMSGVAMAEPWKQVDARDGCEFFVGETDATGVTPIRATCDWPYPATKLQHLLSQFDQHYRYFDMLEYSNLVSKDGEAVLIYQLHRLAGMPDREVVLRMWSEPIEGGVAYKWTKAENQTVLSGSGVEIELDTGMWQVTETADGLHLDYELRYAPGGWVPDFVVRWFQGKGLVMTLRQLHDYLKTH